MTNKPRIVPHDETHDRDSYSSHTPQEKDLYEVARFVRIPGEAMARFIGALELCGYRIAPLSEKAAPEHVEEVYLAVRIAAEGSDWKRDSGESLAAWVDRRFRATPNTTNAAPQDRESCRLEGSEALGPAAAVPYAGKNPRCAEGCPEDDFCSYDECPGRLKRKAHRPEGAALTFSSTPDDLRILAQTLEGSDDWNDARELLQHAADLIEVLERKAPLSPQRRTVAPDVDGQDFYELCQQYRHAKEMMPHGMPNVVRAFENLKAYIKTGELPWPSYQTDGPK